MKKQQLPPLKEPMYAQDGTMSPLWVRWFQDISRVQDDFRRTPDLKYASDVTLTTRDFGKTIVMDTTAGDLTCSLMGVGAVDVYCWLTIFREGINRLTILPTSDVAIEYGSPGGRIWNDETLRRAANVTLQLITATQWGIIGATGIWKIA